ncbi:MAG: hypothetical protein ACYT04_37415 [Nostoc sp.]
MLTLKSLLNWCQMRPIGLNGWGDFSAQIAIAKRLVLPKQKELTLIQKDFSGLSLCRKRYFVFVIESKRQAARSISISYAIKNTREKAAFSWLSLRLLICN